MIRGVRGAIQVSKDEESALLSAAKEIMTALIQSNRITRENVSSVFFTVTPDLTAAFPAAVRIQLGWELVPFLCGQEIPVKGAMERVLRVLILFETQASQEEIHHQYLGGASALRPDLRK